MELFLIPKLNQDNYYSCTQEQMIHKFSKRFWLVIMKKRKETMLYKERKRFERGEEKRIKQLQGRNIFAYSELPNKVQLDTE